jgi:hypothetical protein
VTHVPSRPRQRLEVETGCWGGTESRPGLGPPVGLGSQGRTRPREGSAGDCHHTAQLRGDSHRVCPAPCALTPVAAPPLCPQASLVHREHHDRVVHVGADAGLRCGLLHLQSHPRGAPQLLSHGHHQQLCPRRPLSPRHPAWPCPLPRESCWGGWGPPRPEVPSHPRLSA